MLYSISYAELYFTSTCFPDFDESEFDKALKQVINDTAGNDTFKTILKYSLFVVVPLAIVSIIYVIRIGKYQKEERDK